MKEWLKKFYDQYLNGPAAKKRNTGKAAKERAPAS